MTSITSKVSIKFAPTRIAKAMRPVEYRALYKMSAFVRTRMRSSIRYNKKKTAPAGSPPYARDRGKPNLRTIVFDVDKKTESSIIGPIAFNKRSSDKPAPQTLEHGGAAWITTGRGRNKNVARRIYIRPHPFAQPALDAEIGKFPELLKG